MKEPLYLDANASVPVLPEAKEALLSALELRGNPSSPHALGRRARRLLDEARRDVARALGGEDKEVVFTSGASEANRWLIDALKERARREGRPLCVLASPLEHPSLRRPLEAAQRQGALEVVFGRAAEDGALRFDEEDLARAGALIVTAAHNETGIVPDLASLLARLPEEALVLTDAAQAIARLPPPPARVDAVVASAHKMGGTAGAGALLLRGRARSLPLPWSGGGQEGGRRPGTEPLALLAAFGAAARVVERTRAAHRELVPLRDHLEATLLSAWPDARVVGRAAPRLPNTTALTVPGVDGEALRMAIDRASVCVGFGSACSALAPEPSASLLALGVDPHSARATVRLSLSPGTTRDDVDEAARRLRAAVGQLTLAGRS